MSLLLGLDVGTTNTKAVLFNPETGTVLAVARRDTPVHHPRPTWAEFHAEELWLGAVAVIQEVLRSTQDPSAVRAVAIASMAEAGVPIGADGSILGPVIAWFDPRTLPQAEWWRREHDPRRVYEITGQFVDAKYSVNKLLWLREHAPEQFGAMRHWLCVEDFVLWRLSGALATDYSIASRTMLFDQRARSWSPELLGQAGLPVEMFPTAYPSGTTVGQIKREAAAATGLRQQTVVVTGGHDHLVGALAAGAIDRGSMLDSSGTAGVVLFVDDAFRPDPSLYTSGFETYAHVTPDTFAIIGYTNAMGGAVEWLVSQLWPGGPTDEALRLAETIPLGSGGATWLPHLMGSGTPNNDEYSRAALVGLRPEHHRGHAVRAMLEGLGYWTRENVEVASARLNIAPDQPLVAIGGATRSAFWSQLKADILGRPVVVPQLEESTALGAALLAGVGCGAFPNASAASASVNVDKRVFEPREDAHRAYSERYQRVFQPLYAALRDAHHQIAALEASDRRAS